MEDNTTSIASRVAVCIASFHTLQEAVGDDSQQPNGRSLRIAVADSNGRFRVWSGNIGAHQNGTMKSSLDYRLRDAGYIKIRFIRLLKDLNMLLLDAISITEGSRLPLDKTVDSDSSDSDLENEDQQLDRPTEIEQIIYDIAHIINSLYRLSMSVRDSTWRNRYNKSANINTAYFERFDVDHVRQKYPVAQNFIIDRLGKALSRRRQFLRYRELHAAKLAYAVDGKDTATAPSETTASGIRDPVTVMAFKEIDDLQSETSYATSVGRPTSARIPSMPKAAANEQPFECPFCHTIEIVKDTHAWRKHVYRDLQLYMCTFKDCSNPDETYESRRQWFSHELQRHRRIWTCGGHCETIFHSSMQLIAHLKAFSPIAITEAQIPALIEMRAAPVAKNSEFSCPLCDLKIIGRTQLQKHLGRHLEELALFTLPNNLEEAEDDTDSQASISRSHTSVPISCEEGGTGEHGNQRTVLLDAENNGDPKLPGALSSDAIRPPSPAAMDRSSTASVEGRGLLEVPDHHRDDVVLDVDRTANIICLICRNSGHMARDCHERQSRVPGVDATRDPAEMASFGAAFDDEDHMPVQELSDNVRPKTISTLQGNAEAYFGGSKMADVDRREKTQQERLLLEEEQPRYLNANAMLMDTMEYQKLDVQDHSDLTAVADNLFSAEDYYPFTNRFPELPITTTPRSNNPHEHTTVNENQTAQERVPEKDHPASLDHILKEYESKVLSTRTQLEVPTADIKDRKPIPQRPGILRLPCETFPEDRDPVREDILPLSKRGVPPGARWTKIDRKLVDPEALEQGGERFEDRGDYVIVLRVLTREEVELYATRTQEIRDMQSRSLPKPDTSFMNENELDEDDNRKHSDMRSTHHEAEPSTPSSDNRVMHRMRFDDSEDDHEDQTMAAPRSSEYPVSRGRSKMINFDQPGRERGPERSFQEQDYSIGPDGSFMVPLHTGEHIDDRIRSRRGSRERGRRSPSPFYEIDYETKRKLDNLREREENEEHERQQMEIEHEIQRKAEHEALEKAKRERKEKELTKKKAFEKCTPEEKEKIEKEKKAKEEEEEEADKVYRERMAKTLRSNGFAEVEIEKILNKGDGKGEGLRPQIPPDTESRSSSLSPDPLSMLFQRKWIKVHKKHLDSETLDKYHLPWEWDDRDTDYIIIKQWIPEHDQDILFEHTRKLLERRMTIDTQTVLKKERDPSYLSEKESQERDRPPPTPSHDRASLGGP